MTASVNVTGTWHTVQQIWLKVASSWTQVQQAYVKVGSTWELVFSAFTPTYDLFSTGSGNVTIPTGASHCRVIAVGPGNNGGNYYDSGGNQFGGGGAGGAGIAVISFAISGADWGGTLAYAVAPNQGSNSTSSGTISAGSYSITGGFSMFGADASSGGVGAGGAGGTASGAGTNYTGNAGSAGSGTSGGAGGTPTFDVSGYGSYGNGGAGADVGGSPQIGIGGAVIFEWS